MGVRAALAALLAVLAVAPPPGTPDTTVRTDARTVLMIGIQGTSLDPGTLFHLRDGGRSVILFGSNIVSSTQLRDLARDMACATGGRYLLAVDHEPLRVHRLGPLLGRFPSFGDEDELSQAAQELGRQLRSLGVTMDLAPVLDLEGPSPALRGRTFSSEPSTVAVLGEAFRFGVEEARVAAVVKHFPGHGLAPLDPHRAVTEVDGPDADALAPFQLAVGAGVRAVMVGHPIYTGLDPDSPASSSPVVYDLLRNWGFEGVAVTDALGMVGARNGRTVPETAVAALAAGADLLVVENPAERESVVDALVEAVESGEIDRSRLAAAAARVRSLSAWVRGVREVCSTPVVRE